MSRAIIVAAGRGKRLGHHTADLPKCLVPIGARTILGWQLRALAAAGVDELVMVRGYRGDVLEAGARAEAPAGMKLRFIDNPEWETNNVLLSLACARAELDGPTMISYSDIIFTPAVAQACAASPAEVGLVVDRAFRDIYVGRDQHPLEEAEVADLDPAGRVHRVGKRALPVAEAEGEFIGLAKLGPAGVGWVGHALDQLQAHYAGREDEPFQRAARFRNAYLTDLLQHLIGAGRPVDPVLIAGDWREIDTDQDLARARELVSSAPEVWP